MADYETLRQRHVARFRETAPERFERMTWPAERLHAGRERRLRRLAGIDPDRLCESDLGDLPVMTKDDLMEHFPLAGAA